MEGEEKRRSKKSETEPLFFPFQKTKTPTPGTDLTAEEADALRAHATAFPGATALVRGAWLVACAEAGRLLPVAGGEVGGNAGGAAAKKKGARREERQPWSLSVSDLGTLERSASAEAVAAAAVVAAPVAASGGGGANATSANGGGSAAAAGGAAAATAGALPGDGPAVVSSLRARVAQLELELR